MELRAAFVLCTLARLVLRVLPRDVVELGAVAELREGLFFLAVLLAQDMAHVDAGRGFELGGAGVGGVVGGDGLVAFGFGVGVFGVFVAVVFVAGHGDELATCRIDCGGQVREDVRLR